MATFRYQALLPNGRKTSGFINADDLNDAKQKLLRREFLLLRIKLLSSKKTPGSLRKHDLFLFTKELAKLLQAGLPLFEALLALEEKYRNYKCHPIILDLCEKVKQGFSFSHALKQHPDNFDSLYLCMIENAERSGNLQGALEELAALISRQLNLRKQLLTAIMYPSLLSVFCLVVLSTLLFYVIPSLAELFEGRRLNPFTAFVLSWSRTANQNKGLIALIFLLVASFLSFCFSAPRGKKWLITLGMHLPIAGSLLIKVALIRFCRSSGALLLAGVPILETLGLAKRVMGHPLLEKIIGRAEQNVLEGGKISERLKETSLIPPLVTRMLAIAEEGGNIPVMLQHIAQIYEDELEKNLHRLTQIAQPVLLLFIGAVVGFVLLSVLLPLTDVSSFLENS